jgi:hypothetical protein
LHSSARLGNSFIFGFSFLKLVDKIGSCSLCLDIFKP